MADKAKDKKRADAVETASGPLPVMSTPPAEKAGHHKKFDRETYEAEIEKLQVELVKLQEWIKHAGLRVAVIFGGPPRRRQGRHHQARHRAPQPARRAHRRPRHADRARAH
jgi:hypothetical protein